MTTNEGLERKSEILFQHLKKAAKNGVVVRMAIPADGSANKDIVSSFSKFAKIKQQNGKTARFCIIDSDEILVFLTDDKKVHKSYDCAVWLNAPYFLDYFSSLFETEWKN